MVTQGNNVQPTPSVLKGPLAGHGEAVVELDRRVAKVRDRDVAVCLIGEEGSGKELVARTIHEGSQRRFGPFVCVDCGEFESKEQEVLLFGEDDGRGALCGAFEQASGGVLFLNQVGSLSQRTQAALAQTLSTRKVRRVGSREEVFVNVRIIAAHCEDLRLLVESGRFREDLFFRLVVYPLFVPPLRERRDDIPLIVAFFLRELSAGTSRHFTPEALEALVGYDWPGNIRELEHVVHRSVLAAHDETIALGDLPPQLRVSPLELSPVSSPENEVVPLRDLERRAIEHALRVTKGCVSLAAQKLGIGRATLYRRIASLELSQHIS